MQLVHSGPALTHRLPSGAQPAEQQVCASAARDISAYVKTMIASLRYRIAIPLRWRGFVRWEALPAKIRFGRLPAQPKRTANSSAMASNDKHSTSGAPAARRNADGFSPGHQHGHWVAKSVGRRLRQSLSNVRRRGGRDWKTYAARNNLVCTPGTTFRGADGQPRLCQ
jgi:hypothetical protein